jgi:hypothetical protein
VYVIKLEDCPDLTAFKPTPEIAGTEPKNESDVRVSKSNDVRDNITNIHHNI